MKKKSDDPFAFIHSCLVIVLLVAGVVLAVFGSASAQSRNKVSSVAQRQKVKASVERPADNFWDQTNGPEGGDGMALATNASGHVFVGTQGGGVFRSIDNAETWVGVNNGLIDTNVQALAINSAGHIFAGTFSSGVFRSTDNGDSWTAVSNGLDSLSVRSFAINSEGDIFAGTFYGGIYRSTDNGENWTAVNNGLTGLYIPALAINASGQIFAATWDVKAWYWNFPFHGQRR